MYITSYSTIFQISLYCMLCIPLQVVIPCPFLAYHRCLNRVVREHSSFERETINLSLGSEKKREDERKKGDPKSKKKKKNKNKNNARILYQRECEPVDRTLNKK